MAARQRDKSDSASSAIKRLQTASDILRPQMELTARELEFFNMVASSRESTTWSKNDLIIASQLAKNHRRIEDLGRIIDEDGYTQVNERGTKISHPAFAALTQLQAQVQSATRTLGLSASQRGLADSNQKNRNEADSRAREVLQKAAADDLL